MKANLISRITLMSLILSAAAAAAAVSGAALAQGTEPPPVPGHPRVNEVNQRLDNQQDRINAGVKDGQINAKQAARDDQHLSNIAARESTDQTKHGGHLTKAEQHRLNKSLNKNSGRIHEQRH